MYICTYRRDSLLDRGHAVHGVLVRCLLEPVWVQGRSQPSTVFHFDVIEITTVQKALSRRVIRILLLVWVILRGPFNAGREKYDWD
jgi:hypothetical protein